MSLRDDLRMQWRAGGNLTRLILVNLGVFVALILIYVVLLIPTKGLGPEAYAIRHDWLVKYLQAPSDLGTLITRPWSLITHMFLHLRLGHIFWNMLILYWMGRIFQDLLGGRRLLGNYLLGGLSGVLLFILFSNLTTPEDRGLPMVMGASGAVMSVLVGIATYRPTAEIHLLLLGPVKLMYIALALVLLDFMGVGSGDGVAHEAHIGGALYGFVAARQLKRGKDWSKGFVDMLEAIGRAFGPRKGPRMKVAKKPARNVQARDEAFRANKAEQQARVDAILDKISRSGYDSLSKEEKDFLFKASK